MFEFIYMCVCRCVYEQAESRRGHQVFPSITLHISLWDRDSPGLKAHGFLVKLGSQHAPAIFLSLPPLELKSQKYLRCPACYLGCCDPNSDPYDCIPSAPNFWTISPASQLELFSPPCVPCHEELYPQTYEPNKPLLPWISASAFSLLCYYPGSRNMEASAAVFLGATRKPNTSAFLCVCCYNKILETGSFTMKRNDLFSVSRL